MIKTNEHIIAEAKKHGLLIKKDSLQRNDSGVDFQVVFARDMDEVKWVLRYPRREDVLPSAKKEKQMLNLIESKLSVQVPNWKIYTEDLIAYQLLNGVPAGTIDPEAKAYIWEIDEKNVPDVFHETLALAIASLHRIDSTACREAGIEMETAEEARSSMKERMDKVKMTFGVSDELWNRWQNWLANDSLWPKKTALIHGDLHAGHILVDEASRVTGLIDWTEARVTDPAHDFVAHYRTFGEAALQRLIFHYEQAGGYVWPNMAAHVIELTAAYPVGIAEFARKSGLEEYKEMARQVLGV
ncbi:macrolide 2'-phosphotransferase [Brevibacillus laterosporus]|uniref:macrolide 2'-phosphotransferase n=1 Tax=Brevibacillus laterosporus TaxID=1465 RepID=UPI000B9B9BAC|nr:macrolide 2'-phosphotransferase [Brevibacillus laterosporus]